MRIDSSPWILKAEKLSCPDAAGPAPGEVVEAHRDQLERVTFSTGVIVEQCSSSPTYKIRRDGNVEEVVGRMTVQPELRLAYFQTGDVRMQVSARAACVQVGSEVFELDATGHGPRGFVAETSPDRLEASLDGHLVEVGLPLAWNLFAVPLEPR